MNGTIALDNPAPKPNRAWRRAYAKAISKVRLPYSMRLFQRNRALATCTACKAPFLGSILRCQCKAQVKRYAV